jgi:hypothetical protein
MSVLPQEQTGIGSARLPVASPAFFDYEEAALPLNTTLDTANTRHGDLGSGFTAKCITARQGQPSALRFGRAGSLP